MSDKSIYCAEEHLKEGGAIMGNPRSVKRGEPSSSCPFCNSPYAGPDGNVTLGIRDGLFTLVCPKCDKPISDFHMDAGRLVPDVAPGPETPSGGSQGGFFKNLFAGRKK
jgi:hypothetical protein